MLLLENLIDQPVLDVDAARVRATQVTDELLEWRRRLERIVFYDGEKRLGLGLETGAERSFASF